MCSNMSKHRAQVILLLIVYFAFEQWNAALAESRTRSQTTIKIDAVVAKARHAVVSLFVYDLEGRPATRASGFFVSGDGLLVTNRHVVEKVSKITAETDDHQEFKV